MKVKYTRKIFKGNKIPFIGPCNFQIITAGWGNLEVMWNASFLLRKSHRQDYGDGTTKCNVGWCTGSWNRKDSGGKTGKLQTILLS